MSPKSPRVRFAVPFAFAALLCLPASAPAQDDGGAGDEGAGGAGEPRPAAPAPAKPRAEEPPPEVKGNRYRITLKSGAKIEGLLPQGVAWEKRDQLGEFVEAAETEKGAGLRLNYVLNMEGDIFILKKDIAEVKDLGALTEEQMLAIKEMVLAARKKSLEEREKINREELARIAAAAKAEEAAAEGGGPAEGGKKDPEAAKKASKEEKDRKRGDELLRKYPSDQWGPKRIEEIQRRSVINGIFPTAEEQEFIDNFDLWKEAVARRDKEAAERKGGEGGGEGDGGGGDGGGDGGEGEGEETPPPPAPGAKEKVPPAEFREKVPPAEFRKKGE